jgi:hypothetical protein
MVRSMIDACSFATGSLADLVAEREPTREARRLRNWLRAAAMSPELARDPALSAALSSCAHAVCHALARALAAAELHEASAALRDARRSVLQLRALLYVALAEGGLHRVQFDLLSAQAVRAADHIGEAMTRLRVLLSVAGQTPTASPETRLPEEVERTVRNALGARCLRALASSRISHEGGRE